MDLNKAIKMAKGEEEEKVSVSLKLPTTLKTQLQEVADTNSVSVNALVNSIIDLAINGNNDEVIDKSLYKELTSLIDYMESIHDDTGVQMSGYLVNDSGFPETIAHIQNTIDRINVLKKILGE